MFGIGGTPEGVIAACALRYELQKLSGAGRRLHRGVVRATKLPGAECWLFWRRCLGGSIQVRWAFSQCRLLHHHCILFVGIVAHFAYTDLHRATMPPSPVRRVACGRVMRMSASGLSTQVMTWTRFFTQPTCARANAFSSQPPASATATSSAACGILPEERRQTLLCVAASLEQVRAATPGVMLRPFDRCT